MTMRRELRRERVQGVGERQSDRAYAREDCRGTAQSNWRAKRWSGALGSAALHLLAASAASRRVRSLFWSTSCDLWVSQTVLALWIGSRGFMSRLGSLDLPPIVLNGTTIELGDSLKLLRVSLDSTSSWRTQCTLTANKCFAALAQWLLIKALVFPYLDYCVGISLDMSRELKIKLSCCQICHWNQHLRAYLSSYVANEILTFEARKNFLAICLLASTLRTESPYKRRSHLDLHIKPFDCEYFRNSFRIGAAYLWNCLPHDLRLLYRKPNSFKTDLYRYLLANELKC
ncbi:hypothetical protein TSAR_008423 [Trichomalopsis sarcophagae]|uniref:Uncharacterized protein n=1 Tax=Trichomalopsis sarcophagae TaxID=543379 RepID=A0A232ER98_9HYME|nr:hypothetical protein TSAR_008423 [Trichomalopsis sarcophagae]